MQEGDGIFERVSVQQKESSAVPAKVNRRMLLRGASAAVPAILTLQSGSALARSSNLIGAAQNAGPSGGKYRCLDFDGIAGTNKRDVYGLGTPPMAHVTRIDAQSKYYKSQPSNYGGWGGGPSEVSKQKMCAEGGDYYRKDGNRNTKVRVKRGVLVSATALSSFSSGINYTDV